MEEVLEHSKFIAFRLLELWRLILGDLVLLAAHRHQLLSGDRHVSSTTHSAADLRRVTPSAHSTGNVPQLYSWS